MELNIQKEMLIKDIQKAFNDIYPYLKIEFFDKVSPKSKTYTNNRRVNPAESLFKLSRVNEPLKINVYRKRTVGQLENDFLTILDLSMRVFRKSGNSWVETSLTDNWTLEEQNKEGESFYNNDGKAINY